MKLFALVRNLHKITKFIILLLIVSSVYLVSVSLGAKTFSQSAQLSSYRENGVPQDSVFLSWNRSVYYIYYVKKNLLYTWKTIDFSFLSNWKQNDRTHNFFSWFQWNIIKFGSYLQIGQGLLLSIFYDLFTLQKTRLNLKGVYCKINLVY